MNEHERERESKRQRGSFRCCSFGVTESLRECRVGLDSGEANARRAACAGAFAILS